MAKSKTLPPRSKVKTEDTWDLASLYASDDAWEKGFRKLEKMFPKYESFRGRLGESAQVLAECLAFDEEFERLSERVGTYALLKTTEDQADSTYQRMQGRFQFVAVKASQAASYIRPEILGLAAAKIKKFMAAEELAPYRLLLERLLRYQPHTLSAKEENLLAMQGEMAGAASKAFRQLIDADLKFGFVKDEHAQEVELSNTTFIQLLHSPQRKVRQTAFHQFYEVYAGHENTLAATLNGSIQKDIYYAQARNYPSALESSLFDDKVPVSVYDNLIAAVREGLPAVHKFYELRKKKMKLKELHHYDTYVPIVPDVEKKTTWNQAVKLVLDALAPLGNEYCSALAQGMESRWCDRYPNRGKQSGAFSCGTFDGAPYILMNYKPEVLNEVFTLAHEAGHSMHTYYSKRKQPFTYYNYTIFVAEVASTFNEQLLTKHLLDRAQSKAERAFLLNKELDGIRSTIVRQTMFAEFEKLTHALAESGEPLTVKLFKETYRQLLNDYFGPDFAIDAELELECFRIPHFYRAFYVYKYATGLSAAIALSRRVLSGGEQELQDYLSFLSGGCSKFPLELLRDAGVDMEQPTPVSAAMAQFAQMTDELAELL
jgi:oligoendopeptidase F